VKYVLLGYGELDALDVELGAELLAGEVLVDVDAATTVRVRDGEVAVIDGPAAFEAVGSFLLIDVPDLDAAIAVARRWPASRSGSVEVRPVGA
jgi:hypothetical protein